MHLLEQVRNFVSGGRERELREQLRAAENVVGNNAELFTERLAELELQLEDTGWIRQAAEGDREFSRDGLKRIMALSRLSFLKNPLIKRGVLLQVYYVWAQGVQIQAEDPKVNEVVQAFLDNPRNRAELTSHQAYAAKETELQISGNIFFALFTNVSTGEVTVRSIPPDEIQDIVTNPDDVREPWFYKRVYTQQNFNPATGATTPKAVTTYYRDWLYNSDVSQVNGEAIEEAVVFHVKVGGTPNMRFGLPEYYDALDWARAYKDFLSDWATIVKSYARFAWNLTTKGGKNAINAAKQKLATTLGGATGGTFPERNPPPVVGATFAAPDGGAKMEPFKTAGATTKAEDGRRLLLMVAASFGYPETMFGDVSVGTLATAKSLDRPTELKFRMRQTLWSDALGEILSYVVRKASECPSGPLAGSVDPADEAITISFPAILEHDVLESMNAIVAGSTLNGYGQAGLIPPRELARMIMTALGAQNVDELLEELFPNGEVPDWMQQKIEGAADPASPGSPDRGTPADAAAKAAKKDKTNK